MNRRSLLLAPLFALVLAGCDFSQTPPEGPKNASSDGSPNGATGALHAKIVGEWHAMPPASEGRLLILSRAALADPPDTAAFERMKPNAEEREHFQNILRLKKEGPNSNLLSTLRRRVEELDSIRMTFSQDKLVTNTASGTQVEGYEAEAELGNQLVIVTEGEGPASARRAILEFVDDDHILLRKGYHEVPFYRAGTSPEMPAAAATRESDASAAAEPGMPEKTGDPEFDKCVSDYFGCVNQMPPESQDAMKGSLDLVRLRMRQAAKDPNERKDFAETCNSTVQLLKSAGLCR